MTETEAWAAPQPRPEGLREIHPLCKWRNDE